MMLIYWKITQNIVCMKVKVNEIIVKDVYVMLFVKVHGKNIQSITAGMNLYLLNKNNMESQY